MLSNSVGLRVLLPRALRHERIRHDLVRQYNDLGISQCQTRHAEGLNKEALLGQTEPSRCAKLLDDPLTEHTECQNQELESKGVEVMR